MVISRQFLLDVNDSRYFCKCVSKHVPKPLELHKHHVWPLSEGGEDTKDNYIVVLCPTSHRNVHRLWREYEANDGRPSWDYLRNFSEYTRELVEKGRELRRKARVEASRIAKHQTDFTLSTKEEEERVPVGK